MNNYITNPISEYDYTHETVWNCFLMEQLSEQIKMNKYISECCAIAEGLDLFESLSPINEGVTDRIKEGWNKLTYFVERDSIKIPDGGTKVKGLYVQFDNVPSKDIEDAPVYYIDDVSLSLMTKYRDIEVTTPYYSPLQGDVVKIPTATIEDGLLQIKTDTLNQI